MPTEFFTIDSLATFSGLVAAVALLVQFAKPVIKRYAADWAVRPLALVVSWIVQGFYLAVTQGLSPETIGLAVINGFLVALTAAGLYDTVTDPKAQR